MADVRTFEREVSAAVHATSIVEGRRQGLVELVTGHEFQKPERFLGLVHGLLPENQ
jgi:hypothetical protein